MDGGESSADRPTTKPFETASAALKTIELSFRDHRVAPQRNDTSGIAVGCKMFNPASSYLRHFDAHYNKSKSSNSFRYPSTARLTLLSSTQVTKSSMFLLTKKAGSFTTSVPTLTCPCSMNLFAAWTVSAILNRVMTIPKRRRHMADTVTFFSTSDSLPRVSDGVREELPPAVLKIPTS